MKHMVKTATVEPLELRRYMAATLVAQLGPYSYADPFAAGNGSLFWDQTTVLGFGNDSYDGTFESDGTAAGTHKVSRDTRRLFGPASVELTPGSDKFVFIGPEEVYAGSRATRTTTVIKDFDQTAGDQVPVIAAADGVAYFGADDGVSGMELWRSDGTADGTRLVKDIQQPDPEQWNDPDGSAPSNFYTVGDRVYFNGTTTAGGTQVWTTDGTGGGTGPLTHNNAELTFNPQIRGVAGDKLIVSAKWNGKQSLLAVSTRDGSVTFLAQVAVSLAVQVGDRLCFPGTDAAHGTEMWSTDGTPQGTQLLKDVNPGPAGSQTTTQFIAAGGLFYFVAWGGGTPVHNALYVSDGTPAGTRVIPGVFDAGNLVTQNGRLYFTAYNNVYSYTPATGVHHVATIGDAATATFETMLASGSGKLFVERDVNPNNTLNEQIWAVDPLVGSIAGSVFDDANANGARDVGEGALAGYKVFLDRNGDGVCNKNETWTRANSAGRYHFNDLPAGTYTVRVIGVTGRRASTLEAYRVRVAADASVTRNFGRTEKIYVRGTVYFDANKDGAFDGAEAGMSGWTVFADTDGDGTWEAGEPSAITDARGRFVFAALDAGAHTFRVVPLANYRQTAPGAGYRGVTLPPGGSATTLTFGEKRIVH